MNSTFDARPPTDIVLHARSQIVELRWHDGMLVRLAAGPLRAACPCSGCEASRIAGDAATMPAVEVSAIEPIGEYAIRVVFSDGHNRGIYPWSYLRQLSLQISEFSL